MALVLVSNDDGIDAPGILALAEALHRRHEVVVVAPDGPRSASGHSITLSRELTLRRHPFPFGEAFAVNGTPADCVKLGVTTVVPDCDFVFTGVNLGPNVGVNVLYSGTVGAALEAAIQGKPAAAFSVDYPADGGVPDFAAAAEFAGRTADAFSAQPGPGPLPVLNVNFPARGPWKGVRLTRQGRSGFREFYREMNPDGETRRFMVDGDFRLEDGGADIDACALDEGFVSITPLGLDLSVPPGPTGHAHILERLMREPGGG